MSRTIANWDATYALISAEYGGFYQVPLVAYNYSRPFEDEKSIWYQLINDPYANWTALPPGGSFSKEVRRGNGMFRTNDEYTDWEWITIGSGADTIRRHLRVRSRPGYTHSTLVMWHIGGMDSNDTIDIVETEKYKITRCITAYDVDGDGDVYTYIPLVPGGTVSFNEFYGITNKGSAEHTLGTSRGESATISPFLDYVMDGSYYDRVAAFDNSQLLIRPDTYTIPLTDISSPEMSSQHETFAPTLFPTLAQVQLVRDTVGFAPLDVAKAVIYADYTYNYEVPEWSPSDLGLE